MRGLRTGGQLGAALLLGACGLPLVALIWKSAGSLRSDLLPHLLATVLPSQLVCSLVSATGAMILAALLASGGVLCGLFEFRGRLALERLLLLPLLVPSWFLAIIAQHQFDAAGPWALALVLGLSWAPLVQLLTTAALRALPRPYYDVLQLHGRCAPSQLVRHLLPLALPALMASMVLAFLLAWADGGSARVLGVPTLTIGLYDQWFGLGDDSAGALIALLLLALGLFPAWLLWGALRRNPWQDSARLQVEGLGRVPLRGPAQIWPWLLGAPLLLGGVLYPGALIVSWTASRLERVSLDQVGPDILRSLSLAMGGVLIASLLSLPVLRGQLMSRARWLTAMTGRLLLSTFAIPPVVLGLAFLCLLPSDAGSPWSEWLNATPLPLLAALGARFAAVPLMAGQAALLRSARPHSETVRLSGHTGMGSVVRLFLPFLRAPLTAAGCFVLLEGLKELSLCLILQPFGFTTLSSRVFQYAQTQRIPECAVPILCLALTGLYPLWLLARAAASGWARQEAAG